MLICGLTGVFFVGFGRAAAAAAAAAAGGWILDGFGGAFLCFLAEKPNCSHLVAACVRADEDVTHRISVVSLFLGGGICFKKERERENRNGV